MDPWNIEAMWNIANPIDADGLSQLVHCCQWMSIRIPDYHQQIDPLQGALEVAYRIEGEPRRSALKHVNLAKGL